MPDLIVRKAKMQDIPAMARLINDYAAQEIMLPRNEMELAESIRDFFVAELVHADMGPDTRQDLVGCVALHFYTPIAGEVRSLAVDPAHSRHGIGRKMLETLEAEARDCDLATLFAFTYVPDFFSKLGYARVDRNILPLKAWKDCLRCPKFQNCDEIAVLKRLKEIELRPITNVGNNTRDLVQLPTPRS
jgi:amino-acid N-acetyltransferase